MTARVLIADEMSPRAAEILGATPGIDVDVKTGMSPAQLAECIADYEAILVRSSTKLTSDLIGKATRLKLVGRAGIGVDNIDVGAATARGVIVMNTPFGNAATTAEHAIAMMFSVVRNIPQATAAMREGRWDKKKFKGHQITGKTVGIVGLGNIGKLVCERMNGLRAKVVAYDPFVSPEAARKWGAEKVTLDELFAQADYITIHVPLLEATKHLVNADAFAKMKQGVYLVHCARGGIVDEQALIEALEVGKVAGAALDVFEQEPPAEDHPLRSHPRVILTPHLGASTVEAQEAVAVQIAEQTASYLIDGTVLNALNTTSVSGDVLKTLGPALTLATRVGALAGQLHTADVEGIEVIYHGDLAELEDQRPLTARVVTAVLAAKMGGVNDINARHIATERGIEVASTSIEEHPDFTNLLTVRIKGGAGTEILGAIYGKKDARIVGIDGYRLEMVPSDHVLLIKNQDQPGIIGAIGTELGKRDVNVSRCVVGLKDGDPNALAVWTTDSRVADDALGFILDVPGILKARRVEL